MSGDDMERLRKAMAARFDAVFLGEFGGATSTNTPPSEPLTMEKLQRAMASMPPRETWLSTRLFPGDKAFVVEGPNERFTVAHPGFWLRVERALGALPDVLRSESAIANPYSFSLTPIEIDPWPGDDEEAAKWRAAHWDRLREAVMVAMQQLPEWLRSPPKFGEHG